MERWSFDPVAVGAVESHAGFVDGGHHGAVPGFGKGVVESGDGDGGMEEKVAAELRVAEAAAQ